MPSIPQETLQESIARLLPNGLGSKGDEESNPLCYPTRDLHILLACSGSVASVKLPLIVRDLLQVSADPLCESCSELILFFEFKFEKVQVQVVASKSALHFFEKEEIEREHEGKVKVWTDEEEWAVSSTFAKLCFRR